MIYLPKSQPEPNDLVVERNKSKGTYRTDGVLDALTNDFYNKCYICEYKNPTTINIEHFVPHRGDSRLRLDWNNLFLGCAHCNNIKNDNYDNILNCTDPLDEIENSISLSMWAPVFTKEVEVTPLKKDEKTLSTVDLLNKVYNGTTTMKTIESHYIREKLVNELLDFLKVLQEYYTAGTEDLKNYCKLKINEHLHSSSPFTMFKRCIIKSDTKLMQEFGAFVKQYT